VTPAVGAPWVAAFPVMCGETEEDSRVAREEHDASDKNPDHRAAILYRPHVRVWESLRSVDTSHMLAVMPQED
jgi:hypothetical protein